MKIVNMSVSNYRQFKHAELNFNDGITVLAGANNSGKTSLITLIKENAAQLLEKALRSKRKRCMIGTDAMYMGF